MGWLSRKQPLPSSVQWTGTVPQRSTQLYLGVGPRGDVRWDLATAGHLLVVGSAGAGKTETLALITTQAVARGWQVVVCDPLNLSWSHASDALGSGAGALEYGNDLSSVRDALTLAREEVDRRHRLVADRNITSWGTLSYTDVGHGDERALLVVLDEADAFAAFEAGATRAEGRRNDTRAQIADLLVHVVKHGAPVAVHLAVAASDPVALRAQVALGWFGARLCLGDVGARSAAMALGADGSVAVAGAPTGRGVFRATAKSAPCDIQAARLPRSNATAVTTEAARAAVEALAEAIAEQRRVAAGRSAHEAASE